MFYPVYQWINKKTGWKNLSALSVSILIILIIAIPVTILVFNLSKEVNVGYMLIKQKIFAGKLFDIECVGDGLFCNTMDRLDKFANNPQVKFYLEDGVRKIAVYISESAFNFVVSIPKRILDIFITFFIVFFLLKDGENIIESMKKFLPLKAKHKDKIFRQLEEVTRAIIFGFFLMGVIQGILAGIIFWIFNISSPIFWGIVVGVLALIPFIGPAIIYVPAAIIKLYSNSIGEGFGILIGGLVVSAIDTFWKPKIIGTKARIHPVLILLGLIGGIQLFGFIGFIVGPLILALILTFIHIYREVLE